MDLYVGLVRNEVGELKNDLIGNVSNSQVRKIINVHFKKRKLN